MSVHPAPPPPHAEAPASAGLEARADGSPAPPAPSGASFEAPLRGAPQDGGFEARPETGPRTASRDEAREALRRRAWDAAATVCDPELPVLTIADLGILRAVEVRDGVVEVAITPTYSGCPAMDVIGLEVETALAKAGIENARVRGVLAPAWTTDWITDEGKAKLLAYGIAPPPKASRRALFGEDRVACPRCGSDRTEKISEFGSTACKALWRCLACREPFDAFKCL